MDEAEGFLLSHESSSSKVRRWRSSMISETRQTGSGRVGEIGEGVEFA